METNNEPLKVRVVNTLPTMELVNELLNRFDHAVFVGYKAQNFQEGVTIRRWKGNLHTCAGLGLDVAHSSIDKLHDIEEDVSTEDL